MKYEEAIERIEKMRSNILQTEYEALALAIQALEMVSKKSNYIKKEEINHEIGFCESLISKNKEELGKVSDDLLQGYHTGKISSLKGSIRRLKEMTGRDLE